MQVKPSRVIILNISHFEIPDLICQKKQSQLLFSIQSAL